MQDYFITSDKSKLDISAVHAFLSRSYWSPGIPISTVERAISNSLCFSVLLGAQQIGFARLVTDKATFAYLADVYVLEEHRGNGLARRMLELIFLHPDLQSLRRITLITRDAHGLYAKYGFQTPSKPGQIMEINNPSDVLRQ